MINTSSGSWNGTFTSDSGTSDFGIICGAHNWYLESLRGTNRDQRVEHVRCIYCGEKRTRVWLDLPKQGRFDREYPR